jgi:hypothetical protein
MASKDIVAARLAARKKIVPLTREDLRNAGFGSPHVHMNDRHRPDGTCYEWRGNGAMQTWKTRPNEFRWPIKYGMREYSSITQNDVGDFHLARTCPVDRVESEPYQTSFKGMHRRRPATRYHTHPTHPYSHPASTKHRRK